MYDMLKTRFGDCNFGVFVNFDDGDVDDDDDDDDKASVSSRFLGAPPRENHEPNLDSAT